MRMPRLPDTVAASVVLLAVCIFGTWWLSALPGMRASLRARAPAAAASVHVVTTPSRSHAHSAQHARSHAPVRAVPRTPVSTPVRTSAPRPLYAPPPAYPVSALRAHRQGKVVLRVTLASNGHVSTVGVVRSSGDAALDRAAARALRSWIFPPPHGTPRAFDWPLRFRIDSHD